MTMDMPGMVPAPSLGERIDASRTTHQCDRCANRAEATLHWYQRVGSVPFWARRYACRTHYAELVDACNADGVYGHTRWND